MGEEAICSLGLFDIRVIDKFWYLFSVVRIYLTVILQGGVPEIRAVWIYFHFMLYWPVLRSFSSGFTGYREEFSAVFIYPIFRLQGRVLFLL